MKKKRLLALSLAATMALGSLAGCGGSTSTSTSTGSETSTTSTSTATGEGSAPDASAANSERMTIEVYDVAANYQGMQTGWFQKIVNDKFNIDLNIIAPQVAGSDIFQARTATGNLGDLILLDTIDFNSCVEQGLIKDISADIYNYSNIAAFKDPIDTVNAAIGDGTKIYGIPTEMVNSSPTSYSQDVIYSSPMLRWDLYKGVGAPQMENFDDLLDCLEAMMKQYPTNETGDNCYPLSLWADWDGGDGMLGIANVVQLTTWFGEKIKGSAILKPDNTFIPITDKSGSYYKCLKFLNDAYNRGIVDPDSFSQDWNAACAKMSAGQVYLMWYSWQVGFWNTADRINAGNAFTFIPVKDQVYYTDSDTYYGSGRIFGIGSQVDDAKYQRIMQFLDWYASPEGAMAQHNGIEGFTYEKREDGRIYKINDNALMDNVPVPEEYGGAGYSDGNNQINQWIVGSTSVNPQTGEQYASQYWATYKESIMCDMKKEWADMFGAAEPVEYMKKNNVLVISPSVSVNLPADTADISVARNMCNQELCEASWRMIKAKDAADFDAQWDTLTETLNSYEFEALYAFDVEKAQIELEAKLNAK